MDEDVKKLKEDLRILNRAYSDVVAHSIIAIHIYEEYLMSKATSRELAVAMFNLLGIMPEDCAGHKTRKPRKASRISPNGSHKTKGPIARSRKKDAQEG